MTEAQWLAAAAPQPLLDWLGTATTPAGMLPAGAAFDRRLRLALAACCRRISPSLGPRARLAVEAAEAFADGGGSASLLRDFADGAGAEAGDAARNSPGNHAGFAAAWLCQDQALLHPGSILRNCALTAAYAAASYEDCISEIHVVVVPRPIEGDDGPNNVRWRAAHDAERAAQACALRDAFGNPFRPVMRVGRDWDEFVHHDKHILFYERWLDWQGGTVPRLAEKIYAERDFSPAALGVLADALEEAGCMEESLLRHLRGWVACDHRLPMGALGGSPLEAEYWPDDCDKCQSAGWVRSDAPHARGCWALDLLLGKE